MPRFGEHFWVKAVFFGLVFLITAIALYGLKVFIVPIVVGFLIAFLIEPVVEKIEGKAGSRMGGITMVLFVVAAVVILTGMFLFPKVVEEIQDLNSNKEKYATFAHEKYARLKTRLEHKVPGKIPWESVDRELEHIGSIVPAKISSYAIKTASHSLESFLNFFIIVPIFTFFLLKDGISFKKWVIQWVPNRYFELVMELTYNIKRQIGRFIRGQLADCTLNAIMVSTMLGIAGLPFFFIVGIFAGIANAIPFVGPVSAGILGITITIIAEGPNPLIVAGVFVVAHLVDVMLIYPSTVGHSLQLHGLVVILGIMVGGHIGGIVGMLVIIPIIGILKESIQVMFRLLRGYDII